MDNFQNLALEVFLREKEFKYDSYDDRRRRVTWINFLTTTECFQKICQIGDGLLLKVC